jgi:hypothetical protein
MNIFDKKINLISKKHKQTSKLLLEKNTPESYTKYFKSYSNSYLFLIISILELYSIDCKTLYGDVLGNEQLIFNEQIILDKLEKLLSLSDKNKNNSFNPLTEKRKLVSDNIKEIRLNNIIKTLNNLKKCELVELIAKKLVINIPSNGKKHPFLILDQKTFKLKWNKNDDLCKFIINSITSGQFGQFGPINIDIILYNYINK